MTSNEALNQELTISHSFSSVSSQSSPLENRGNNIRRNRYQVRRNFALAFTSMSRSSKFILAVHLIFIIAQISVGVALLKISSSKSETCNSYLFVYCIGYIIRLAVGLPLVAYEHVYPVDNENLIMERNPEILERFRRALDFGKSIWFILGNWWLFTSKPCQSTSPYLFYLSLSYVIIGYLSIFIPLLLLVSLVCCLPFVLFVLRSFQTLTGMDIVPSTYMPNGDRIQGARDDTINGIKTVLFKKDMVQEPSCVICWSEYIENEEIKFFPGCDHHFHSKCATEWLHVNRTCPLCRKDVELESQ